MVDCGNILPLCFPFRNIEPIAAHKWLQGLGILKTCLSEEDLLFSAFAVCGKTRFFRHARESGSPEDIEDAGFRLPQE
jgi:hypothetical protein